MLSLRIMVTDYSKTLNRARELRCHQTEAEKRLWEHLRNKRLQGYKFNRQVPVGSYIADFLCHSAKLIVEVDGFTHGEVHEVAYDERRTEYLNAKGYKVIRCGNGDVFENLNGVLESILIALRHH